MPLENAFILPGSTFNLTRAETLIPTKQTQELKDSHLPGAGLGLASGCSPWLPLARTLFPEPESRQPGIYLRNGLACPIPYTTPVVRAVSLLLPSPQLTVYMAWYLRDQVILG